MPNREPISDRCLNQLPPDTLVETYHGVYRVKQRIGNGEFGNVYLVRNERTGKLAAMKTECWGSSKLNQRLALEVVVLKMVAMSQGPIRSHFCKLFTFGQNSDFKFMVMSLICRTVDQLQQLQPNHEFEFGTAIRLGIQCLDAVSQLHSMGFLHRDLKPQNFGLGLGTQKERVILIDFSTCRRFVHKTLCTAPRQPRELVKFGGAVKYASRAALMLKEQSRKDDLESLFYCILELVDMQALFWQREKDPSAVLFYKQRVFSDDIPLMKKFPAEFARIQAYINQMDFYSLPDYSYVRQLLYNVLYWRRLDPSKSLRLESSLPFKVEALKVEKLVKSSKMSSKKFHWKGRAS